MEYNPFSLKGKKLLITGASSGIGRATAVECSRLGASVVLTGRREDELNNTLALIEDASYAHHTYVVADLALEEDRSRLVKELPQIDGAVLNAGISKMAPIQFITEQSLEDLFKVNTFAPILLMRQLLKAKRLSRGASVVFTSSISGFSNTAIGLAEYGASKSALTSYMKYAALELAQKGIRCNAVHPGRIETPLIALKQISDEDLRQDQARYPLGRYGRPEEVAWAIAYLLSDAAAWVTGSSLVIDGGRSLK
ncbi:MAG: SDR family oxidoreductase [Bacteroidales bacterium]|nr:SDR family oxidoreductase [Bacteroidales bacterium]